MSDLIEKSEFKVMDSINRDINPEFKKPSGALLDRKGLQRLDILLLIIEALDLNSGEAMIWAAEQMGLKEQLPNRVEIWKLRCYNPLRKTTRRGQPTSSDTDALIKLLCSMSERLYPLLHQLLSSNEPEDLSSERWNLLKTRLSELIEERMNPRRAGVHNLLHLDKQNIHLRQLVFTLALSSGSGGEDRLRASLLDPTFL